jgi:Fe-S-cluster containining protein
MSLHKPQPSIKTLPQFYAALDRLYRDIEQDCHDCKDLDCMGYIWLLEEEANRLYEQGIPLVQINNGPTFIHSFPSTPEGKLDVSVRYPLCSQLCTGSRQCSIHSDRPMVCHLYPLGLETASNGTVAWVLHLDCLHVRRMKNRNSLSEFEQRAIRIINNLSPELLDEIARAYDAVDAISSFPYGENNCSILKEVRHVKMQSSSG